jgi:23S rRNA pseudouridine1911/1915/1917 synthase
VSERRAVHVTPGMPARLDAVVRAALPAASRRLVRALIEDGSVRVNGRRAAKGSRVAVGDLVELPAVAALAPEPEVPLRVLHEDAELIAIDKPGGVPGHALDPHQRGTMAGALLARYPELAGVGGPAGAGLVHRLDTGTSGVLLAARSTSAYTRLREAFRNHDVVKRYVAVVQGVPAAGTAIEVPLAHDPTDRRRMRAARSKERAWPARTVVVAVDPSGARALVHVEIHTGVTHQVRVHLALAGHPVVGDVLYGGACGVLPAERHALHAAILELPGRRLRIVAPLPDDLRALVARG